MSGRAVANVRKGRCRYECRSTWRYEHGGSVPGGPFPGTMADPGDVRLCEHGEVWEYVRTYADGFFNKRDAWTRLSRWQPLARRRALAALYGATPEPADGGASPPKPAAVRAQTPT